MSNKTYKCKLCNKNYKYEEMSEEHYPAKSVGNEDIVALDIIKVADFCLNKPKRKTMLKNVPKNLSINEIKDYLFDNEFSKTLYPKGRTARTLCINCNRFLGKYDEAYLKFFNNNGECSIIKGFSLKTKIKIIKAVYAKFLSIPETKHENFDFLDFIKNDNQLEYNGIWKLYVVKRDFSSDLLNFRDIGTGKLELDNGMVYEFSDEKFIYNLMNIENPPQNPMTNIFDITKKQYTIIEGSSDFSFHGQIMLLRIFKQLKETTK